MSNNKVWTVQPGDATLESLEAEISFYGVESDNKPMEPTKREPDRLELLELMDRDGMCTQKEKEELLALQICAQL